MLIRLTTPENLDRLIDYMERERNLVWPDYPGFKPSYKDEILNEAKEQLKSGTVLMDVAYEWDFDKNRVVGEAGFIYIDELRTDATCLRAMEN